VDAEKLQMSSLLWCILRCVTWFNNFLLSFIGQLKNHELYHLYYMSLSIIFIKLHFLSFFIIFYS